jgi:hypothetical protein
MMSFDSDTKQDTNLRLRHYRYRVVILTRVMPEQALCGSAHCLSEGEFSRRELITLTS